MMVKTMSGVRFFKPQKGYQNLIVNLVDSDYGWSSSVVRVFGPLDAASASDRRFIHISWNMDSFQLSELTIVEAKDRALKLHAVTYNYHKWSWLLNSQRPQVLPTIPGPETSDQDDAVSLSDNDREEIDVDVRLTSSWRVGPLRISLQKKGEKS